MKRITTAFILLVSATACSQGESGSNPTVVTAEHNGIWLAAQPTAADLQQWADDGRTVVINIRPDDEIAELPFEESTAAFGAGLTYAQFGVGGSDGYSRGMTTALSMQLSMHSRESIVIHSETGERAAHLYTAHLIETDQIEPENADSLGLAPGGELDPAVMRQLSRQFAEAFPE